KTSVKLVIPTRVSAKPRDTPTRDDFKDAAECIARALRLVNQSDHARLRCLISATQWRVVGDCSDLGPTNFKRPVGHTAELDDVAAYLHVEGDKQLFRQCSARDTRRRLACRRALKHIAQVACAELLPAREVCM